MSSKESLSKLIDQLRGSDGRIESRWKWIGGGILAIFLIVIVANGSFWGFVAVLGGLALVVGVFATVTGSAKSLRVRSRSAGVAVLVAGIVALSVGSSAYALVSSGDKAAASADVSNSAPLKTKSSAAPATQTPSPTPTPVLTQAEVQETAVIPYGAATVEDSGLDVGTTAVTVTGQNGEKTTTYLVKYVDGVESSRELSREEVTIQPVSEVTAIGTRVPQVVAAPAPSGDCNSNYADVCVPNASDVDCAGGSGNGPAYVSGPLRVVGNDVYDLDRDGDGIACD